MSPVYTPEISPPKLDRFCYLSHPAQRVMVALYNDYLQRKRDLQQCQVFRPPGNQDYYKSIYQSRFGSAPQREHEQSTLGESPNTSQSGSTFNMVSPYNEETSTDHFRTKQPSANHHAYNQNNIKYQSRATKGRNITFQASKWPNTNNIPTNGGTTITPCTPNVVGSTSWMSCDTSTYSDSPPIETQAYRILSQFQPEDFKDTYDDGLGNETDKGNAIESKITPNNTSGLEVYVTSNDTCLINGSNSSIVREETASYWCGTDTTDVDIDKGDIIGIDKGPLEIIQSEGQNLSGQSEETGNQGVDGSQSLFSDDEDKNGKELPVNLLKRQGRGKKMKKCAQMQQIYEKRNNKVDKVFINNKGNQEVIKPNPVKTNSMEHDTSDCGDSEISFNLDENLVSRPVGSNIIIEEFTKQNDMAIHPSFNVELEDVLNDGSPDSYSPCPGKPQLVKDDKHEGRKHPSVNITHNKDIHDKPYTGLEVTLGGQLKKLSVANSYNQETLENKDDTLHRNKEDITEEESPFLEKVQNGKNNSHKNKEFSTEMESPFSEKASDFYPVFDGNYKAMLPEDSEKSSMEERSKGGEKKRKIFNSFAVPFKKPRLPQSLPRSDATSVTEACLVDTDRMPMTELQQMLNELLKCEEVVIVLIYKDTSTQLRHTLFGQDTKQRKNISKGKQNDVEIDSLAISSRCLQHKSVFTFPVKTNDQHFDLLKDFWCQLLRSQSRKVGFHVKETLAALMNIYKLDIEKVDTTWTVLDPAVGLWLLDPDKPITGFEAVLHALCLPEQVPSNDCLNVLYEDLMLLGVAMEKLSQKLKSKGIWDLFVCIESKLTTILAGMELRTLHIATHTLIKFSEILKKKLKKLEQKAHQAVGHAFLLNSHAQLRQVLFEELRLDSRLPQKIKLAKTNVGRETSTSETVLTQLSPFHDLPGIVLEYRQLQKLKSTYIDGILSCIKEERLTTHWDQTAAATGRLTSYHPNIQAIPKLPVTISGYQDNYIADKDVNDEIEIYARDAFISRPGCSLVAADFQQIELRLLAHLANDPVLLQNFKDTDNPDIFNVLTAQWLGKTVDDVSSSEREQTKRVVYSVMYGAGKEKLAEYLKITPDNAKAIMSSFLTKFPSVGQFTKKCVEFCQKNGYTSSIFNRRRLFPNIKHPSSWLRAQAERQCVNFCIQGSAADICKAAMIQIENAITTNENLHAQLLVQIHDELLIEVADEDIQKMIEIIRDIMQCQQKLCGSMVTLQVPIPVSVSVGKKWGQMKLVETV